MVISAVGPAERQYPLPRPALQAQTKLFAHPNVPLRVVDMNVCYQNHIPPVLLHITKGVVWVAGTAVANKIMHWVAMQTKAPQPYLHAVNNSNLKRNKNTLRFCSYGGYFLLWFINL